MEPGDFILWACRDTLAGGLRRFDGTRINEHTCAAVARVRALKAQGLTLRKIAETITEERRRTKRDGKWAAETVRMVLSRKEAP